MSKQQSKCFAKIYSCKLTSEHDVKAMYFIDLFRDTAMIYANCFVFPWSYFTC